MSVVRKSKEAFTQVAGRVLLSDRLQGHVLWAFDRESALVLLDYLRSESRQRDGNWKTFLLHVPSHFLKKKAREDVSKKLGKLLLSAG